MPDDDEGTTEFRARGLKDLLESQEAPAKPAGGDQNRRLMMIGGGVGAVLVVILAVVLLGGGGGDKGGGGGGGGSGVPVAVELRPSAAIGFQKGDHVSFCDVGTPVAEDVVVSNIKPGKTPNGQDTVVVSVLAEGAKLNALSGRAKSTWRALNSTTCPVGETTATTTATTLPPVQPPASTPPDSTPTPPPS